jgi:tetratricopeptide (TPR) repeat protein
MGETGGSAAVALASLLRYRGEIEEARAVLAPVCEAQDPGTGRVSRAEALAELGALFVWEGSADRASQPLEEALTILELEQAWAPLANALIHRAIQLVYSYRREEGFGVLSRALSLAEAHDLWAVALRARLNLAQLSIETDRFSEALEQVEEGLTLARERGDRMWERQLLSQRLIPQLALGLWDDAQTSAINIMSGELDLDAVTAAAFLTKIASARGDESVVERCVKLANQRRDSAYVDQQAGATLALARAALERGETKDALAMSRAVLESHSIGGEFVEEAYAIAIDAAILLSDRLAIDELVAFVAGLPPARATPLLRAGQARLAAEQAHQAGDSEAAKRLEDEALELLRSAGARPLLARALLDRSTRRDDAKALGEARAIYLELGASHWLAQLEQVGQAVS